MANKKQVRPIVTKKSHVAKSMTRVPFSFLSLLIPSFIGIVTFLAFSPALQNGFVNWDDPANLLENVNYQGLGLSNLYWMFTTFYMSLYRPLTWMAWSLVYHVWGIQPSGYHLISVLLHCANAVLFYFLNLKLLRLIWPASEVSGLSIRIAAVFAALFFSIHPLRVEAVAWISAFNDVLSGTFFLGTILCYLSYVSQPEQLAARRIWFVAAVGVYSMSLLAKGGSIGLPVVLLALDYYPLRRLLESAGRQFAKKLLPLCYEKLPFILVSFGAVILNVMAKYESGAMESLTSLGVESRLAYSLYGIIFYLWKTLLPVDLSPLYEPTTDFNLSQMIAVTSGVIGMILSVGLFALRHRFPAGLTVWICYLALVVPFLGFAHAGLQLVADRYSYLSCMVWPIVLASFFSPSWRMNRPRSIGSVRSGVSMGVVLVVLFVLGTLTWRQTKRWENSVTLWRHAVSVTPSGIVYYQLGQALAFDNQEDEAVKYLKQAIDVYPRYANPHWVLGMIMAKRGSLEDASKSLRRAVELEPKKIDIHREYAGVLARQGKMDEAVASFHRALELNPADTASLNNLGLTLVRQGKTDEAIRYFTRVIETSPGNLEAHVNMANALLVRGDGDGALRYLYQALEISPDNVELHKHLAMVLSGGGDLKGAESHLLKAVELNPQDAANYSNLAIVFANQGDLGKAALYFEQALGINPNLGQAHLGLARVLAAQGKTDEATSHHQAALRILRTQPAAPDPH